MTTKRWILAIGGVLALALLTLPGARSLAGRPFSGFTSGGGAAEGVCDADAKPAPLDFTLRDIDGNEVNLAALKGNVILLNFWATWCGPCKIEIPWFVEFQREHEDDGLVVLGLSVDDTPEQIRPFAAEFQVNYPMLVGRGREDFQEAYGPVWGLPVTFFIDRDGTLCRTHLGAQPREAFEADLAALL